MMGHLKPLVLEQASFDDMVRYVLNQHHGPSTIISCGTKANFIAQLTPTPTTRPDQPAKKTANAQDSDTSPSMTEPEPEQPWWAVPTLQLLASTRNIKVVFCPDITHLRAYLATYRLQHVEDSSDSTRNGLLAVLNPIDLHRQTSAFSAQGLSRTFSVAVEAAHRSGERLVIAECIQPLPPLPGVDIGLDESHAKDEPGDHTERVAAVDPWDEEVSILNVTTKSFGVGERGWVGRAVKLRAIVARWCTFEVMNEPIL